MFKIFSAENVTLFKSVSKNAFFFFTLSCAKLYSMVYCYYYLYILFIILLGWHVCDDTDM